MSKNVVIIPGANYSNNKVRKINLGINAPTINVASNYVVRMSSVDNLPIYYTTDGSSPTKNSTLYVEPFQYISGTFIKAICYDQLNNIYSPESSYNDTMIFSMSNLTFNGGGQNILSPVLNYNSDYTILYDFTPFSTTGTPGVGFFSSPIARIWFQHDAQNLRITDPGHTLVNSDIVITNANIVNVRVKIVFTSHNGKIRYKAKVGDSYTGFREFNNVEASESTGVCNIGLFAWYNNDLISRAASGTLHSVQIYSIAYSDEQMVTLLG